MSLLELSGVLRAAFEKQQALAEDETIKLESVMHEMRNAETGEIAATCEITGVYMDRQARKSAPFPGAIRTDAASQLVMAEPA